MLMSNSSKYSYSLGYGGINVSGKKTTFIHKLRTITYPKVRPSLGQGYFCEIIFLSISEIGSDCEIFFYKQ